MSSVTRKPARHANDESWQIALDTAIVLAQRVHGEKEGIECAWRYVGLRILAAEGRSARHPQARPKVPRQPVPRAVSRAVIERDGGRCVVCGSGAFLSIDHIVPVCDGGTNTMDNLRTLCLSCNTSKGVQRIAVPDETRSWYCMEEICDLMGVGPRTIYRMVNRGQIASRQHGQGYAVYQPTSDPIEI